MVLRQGLGQRGIEFGFFPTVKEQSSAEGLIDINHASQEELESLPGIGPVFARAMISYRESQPFSEQRIFTGSGIGRSVLKRFAPYYVSP